MVHRRQPIYAARKWSGYYISYETYKSKKNRMDSGYKKTLLFQLFNLSRAEHVSLVFCAHSGLNVKICNPNELAILGFCNRVSVQLIEWRVRFKDIEKNTFRIIQ